MEYLSLLISMASLIFSISTYFKNVKKEIKIVTIKEYQSIKEEFLITKNSSNSQKRKYLNRMELFCMGLDNKVYDFKVVSKIARNRLINQYDDNLKDYIDNAQKKQRHDYIPFEYYMKLINRLKKTKKL